MLRVSLGFQTLQNNKSTGPASCFHQFSRVWNPDETLALVFLKYYLKAWKSYFLAVDLCHSSQDQHAQSFGIDSGTYDFRLNSSHLFYLSKFRSVVHTKCTYRSKTGVMSQAWSHVFLNLSHNSFQTKERLVRMVDQNGGKFAFHPNHFFRRSSLGDI